MIPLLWIQASVLKESDEFSFEGFAKSLADEPLNISLIKVLTSY
jgi:hypothetical protein